MQIWRTTLVPGDESRDWFAMWSRSGLQKPDAYQMIGGDGIPLTLTHKKLRPSTWIDEKLCVALQIPSRTPFGRYQLFENGVPLREINVTDRLSPPIPPVVRNQRFVDSQIMGVPHTLYHNCVFERSSVFASGGLFLDCEWKGLAYPGSGNTHAFSTWKTDAPLAIIGGLFDGCDRGPVLNLMGHTCIEEPLFLGLTLRNISHVDGGNELLCVESQRHPNGALMFPESLVYRPIVSGWRCYSNEGDFYIAGPTEDMLVQDVVIDRGNIVAFKNSIRGGKIAGCELRRGRIVPAESTDLAIERCALLDRRPTRGNRTYTERYFYEPKLDEVKAAIYNLPDGVTRNGDLGGVSVKECHFG